jgi:hypothetical protein
MASGLMMKEKFQQLSGYAILPLRLNKNSQEA